MPKLKTFDSYQFSTRGTLTPGDRFRVSGGPVYQCADGTKLRMYERGEFVFVRYCERGASKWLEAHRHPDGAFVVLWVGRSIASPLIPNLRRRPYRVTVSLRHKIGTIPRKATT
ncbi:MAG: hypothetical protein AB7O68_09420 [Pirellulales bacterium]